MAPPSNHGSLVDFVRAHPDATTSILAVLGVGFVLAAAAAIVLFASGQAWKRLYEVSEARRLRLLAALAAPETREQRRARKLINLADATDNVHERRSAVRIAEELSARIARIRSVVK